MFSDCFVSECTDCILAIAALRVYAVNGRLGDWRISAVVFLFLLLRSAYDVVSARQCD